MSPRFASLRIRPRGLRLPVVVALGPDRDRRRGHVRDDGRDRPLAGRHVEGAAPTSQMTQDALELERRSSTSRPASGATCSPTTSASWSPTARPRAARRRLDGLDGSPAVAARRASTTSRATSTTTSRLHRAADPGHAARRARRDDQGKSRLDGLRAEFAALSSAQAAITGAPRELAGAAPPDARARRRRRLSPRAAGRCSASACSRFVLLPVRRVARAAERLARAGSTPASPPTVRRDRPARRLVQHDGRGAGRARGRPERADRPAAGRSSTTRPRRSRSRTATAATCSSTTSGARDGPGRRRRDRPHRRRDLPA